MYLSRTIQLELDEAAVPHRGRHIVLTDLLATIAFEHDTSDRALSWHVESWHQHGRPLTKALKIPAAKLAVLDLFERDNAYFRAWVEENICDDVQSTARSAHA